MKQNSFYTIQRSSRGLFKTREYWQVESYKERDQYIVSCYMERKGMPPSKNMHYLREITFGISDSVTLDDLIKVSGEIRKTFIIDCFQISIDRKRRLAHMLFDFMNKETMAAVQINQSNYTNLQVLLIRNLGLPVPAELRDQWCYHSLRCVRIENPGIFQEILDECAHLNMGKYHYSIIRDLTEYAESSIGHRTQKLLKIK